MKTASFVALLFDHSGLRISCCYVAGREEGRGGLRERDRGGEKYVLASWTARWLGRLHKRWRRC
jgi:hypothetical protein